MNVRLPLAILTTCLSVAALTACGSSDGPETMPSASASQSATDAESDEGRYDAALKQFTEYQSQLPTYQRDPKLNAATKAFYTKYWVDPSYQLKVVEALDKGDVETRGAAQVLKSQQQTVTSTQVDFRQCVDYSKAVVIENGKRLRNGQKGPQWRYISMQRQSASLPWLIKNVDENTKEARPCDGQ